MRMILINTNSYYSYHWCSSAWRFMAKKQPQEIDELINQAAEHEKEKISLPETIIFILLAASADVFEIFGVVVSLSGVGAAIGILAFLYGLMISFVIVLWSFFRSVGGSIVVKLAVRRSMALIGGAVADALTGGVLPMRTIVLAITIWLNNKFADKELGRILGILEKFSKVV